jgi:hypothetical protein
MRDFSEHRGNVNHYLLCRRNPISGEARGMAEALTLPGGNAGATDPASSAGKTTIQVVSHRAHAHAGAIGAFIVLDF